MAFNTFGMFFKMSTFGESHGPALGVVVDGVPAGLPLAVEDIQRDLDRRRPGASPLSTQRNEADLVEILSGVFQGKTTGAPVAMLIRNRCHDSSEYEELKKIYRPGHSDWTWEKKFGIRDWRGGGRSSGRETAARVAAGAVARLLLNEHGIWVRGTIKEIGGIAATLPDTPGAWQAPSPPGTAMDCLDREAAARMEEAILKVSQEGDSLGGVVEVRAFGVPPGLGEPVFDKLDARLGYALLSIGAVKAVEFGDGFELARMKGSESNDQMAPPGAFLTNHAGGVLGGISNGQVLTVRAAVKPTPSISMRQQTVDSNGEGVEIEINGRHDPCIVPRLVPVAEAMVNLVLADLLLLDLARKSALSGASIG